MSGKTTAKSKKVSAVRKRKPAEGKKKAAVKNTAKSPARKRRPKPASFTFPGLYDEMHQAVAKDVGPKAANQVIFTLAAIYGGRQLYFPNSKKLARIKRNLAICAECDGTNYVRLAEKYGVGERSIRRIVAEYETQQLEFALEVGGETLYAAIAG